MATLKLRAIGNSVGVVLPKDLLARLRVGEGDTLQVVETPDGFRVIRHDPELQRQMEVGARGDAPPPGRAARTRQVTSTVWLSPDMVLAIHEEQLAEHGGGEGIRDMGLLESALGPAP